MPSTDQMIADLVAKGFKLPEGLRLTDNVGWVIGRCAAFSQRKAHDLCACECARELTHGKRNNARALGLLGDPLDLFREWLGKGDTEAAIKALWRPAMTPDATLLTIGCYCWACLQRKKLGIGSK